jgi:hypothetical protein|tara:strand:- start:5090 stop:5287 length:198 start_codon:yes stop_codon:yes gene_type:complete
MSQYPEIACAVTKEIGGKSYKVRRYGINNQVFEEELYPIPAEKIIRTMKADGTEDVTKRKTEVIK